MKKELLIGIVIGAGALALFAGASPSSLLFGAIILACPLMMLFMGHGTDHDAAGHDSRRGQANEMAKVHQEK